MKNKYKTNNKNELEKTTAVFEIGHVKKQSYKIRCTFGKNFYVGGEKNTLTCVPKIASKKFAEYLKKILENHWDSNQKIIRFYKNPKSSNVKITNFCEFHDPKELKELFKQYRIEDKQSQKVRHLDYENSEKSDLEVLKKEFASMMQKMEILQERIEDVIE